MKNAFNIILFTLLFINCKAQTIVDITQSNTGDNSNKYFKDINNHFAKFTGTWENTTGNITFRVNLWKEEKIQSPIDINSFYDLIRGSYQIIQNIGTPNEVILHNSVKYYPINNLTSYSIIRLSTGNGSVAGGSIDDNCTLPAGTQMGGRLRMEITNPGQTPAMAHWTVKRGGIKFGNTTFTVPTDIILTKVN